MNNKINKLNLSTDDDKKNSDREEKGKIDKIEKEKDSIKEKEKENELNKNKRPERPKSEFKTVQRPKKIDKIKRKNKDLNSAGDGKVSMRDADQRPNTGKKKKPYVINWRSDKLIGPSCWLSFLSALFHC